MNNGPQSFDRLIGYVVIFGTVSGSIGLILAVLAFVAGEWIAAGLGLLAAGTAFGLLAVALLNA